MQISREKLATIGLTAGVSALLTVFIRNFISGEKKIKHRIAQRYGIADPQFERAMSQLLGPPIIGGNQVVPLQNGRQIFPAMLDAIDKAERTITFETFIYWSGEVADRFADLLAAKAKAGIKVHVLIDAVGCNCVNGQAIRKMVDAGVELELYHMTSFARVNHRTHRKLLVVDGKVGFTGGVGIADHWDGDATDPDHFRDTQYRVEGPVVAQMQAAFLDNWMKTRAVVLHGESYFPALQDAGNLHCQMFKSSPMEGSESARLMYLLSIAAAERSIQIGNAYFLPDDLTTQTLLESVERGVKVDVLLPGRTIDSPTERVASRHRLRRLLEGGVRVHEYQPTMYHCKCMMIDEHWTSVGSANFDNRSFRINDEANLNVIDPEFTAQEVEVFKRDLQQAREFTIQDWHQRSTTEKIAGSAAALLRSQL
ncbi:phospholipase D-like domain-containing protein [Luteolibacter arcticus]|uniref:Phospholipase D-like domain-containing protein n=1 Tax=Luteolibacter arcticus TaxID=1581411 RepID=A0ABT3GQP2_9BACT|nr:phospholipase D-like domain-containing protein [Luteolibacter arcticus]MCW1925844.1 phospholipase D-like domain-containing protein [Luteolibacter arcticus]